MSLAPVHDLRDDGGYPYGQPMSKVASINLEAERSLLGILLYENAALHQIEGLTAAHFHEPFHQGLFQAISDKVTKGVLAEPVLIARLVSADPAFDEFGGITYLANLVDKAPAAAGAADYAREIVEASTRREIIGLTEAAAREAREGIATPEETIGHIEAGLLALTRPQSRTKVYSAGEAARLVLDHLDEPEGHGGISTGIKALDDQMGLMQPDELILIPGRPGMGKSALGGCIALNVSAQGVGVIEVNAEMTPKSMMWRHLTDLLFTRFGKEAPTYKDIKRRQISGHQRQMVEWAAEEVAKFPLSTVKRTGLTLSGLRSLVRREASAMARRGIDLGLITVDHVGLLSSDDRGRDRYTDQTNIAIGMKMLADELHIPVIALVQLSRQIEQRDNKRPMLSDMRDTGAWEENADTVIGCYRDAYYANKEPEPKDDGRPNSQMKWADWDARRRSKIIEAIFLKVREGEEGTAHLWASIGHNAIRTQAPHDGGLF